MSTFRSLATRVIALFAWLPGAALALPLYSNLYVLGDSLLDAGNAHAITGVYPVSPPYAGRFSNGQVASEVLAANLGLTAVASQIGGTNYATGGATSGPANFAGLVFGSLTLPPPYIAPPPNQIALLSTSPTGGLSQQIGALTSAPPADIDSSLVVVWAGANDLFLTSALVAGGILPPDPSTFVAAADAAASNVEIAIDSLVRAGAKNVLAVNLPDFGRIPAADSAETEFLWSLYANEFNKEFLDGAYLAGLDPSVTLTEFDMFALFNDAIADPADYGLTNVTDACLPSEGPVPVGRPCAEPDAFLFWDIVHPTARAHRIIGNQFYRAVPEPSSAALLIVALGVLIGRHKRLIW